MLPNLAAGSATAPRSAQALRDHRTRAAIRAAAVPGPLQQFYAARVATGMKPAMARLTLARKIAAITLIVWKKGVCFDAEHLKPQAA